MAINQSILVTVDAIIFRVENGKRKSILLIERKSDPFKSHWAFPGGFVEEEEDLPVACARELEEETGLQFQISDLKQFKAVGTPGRDPRGRTVTIAFIGEVDSEKDVAGDDDAAKAQWWPLDDLPKLAFDHDKILRECINSN